MFTKCEHEFNGIIGFCLSKGCHGNSSYCLDCIQRDTHDSHIVDLKSIDEITSIVIDQQTKIDKIQPKIQNLCSILINFNEKNVKKLRFRPIQKMKYIQNQIYDQFQLKINNMKECTTELSQLLLQPDKKLIEKSIFKIRPQHQIHKKYYPKGKDFYKTYYEKLNKRVQQFIQLKYLVRYEKQLSNLMNLYEKNIKLKQPNYNICLKIVEFLERLGESDLAIQYFERILNLHPKEINWYQEMGLSLINRSHQIEEINGFNKDNFLPHEKEIFQGNIYNTTSKPYGYYQELSLKKCELLESNGDSEEAIKCYEEYLQVQSDEIGYLKFIDVLLRFGQYSKCLQYLEKCLQKLTQNNLAQSKLKQYLEIEDNTTKAIKYFNKIIQIQPNNVFAYSKIGQMLELKQRYDEAFQCYDKIIQLEPQNELGYLLKGDALEKCKNFEGAIQCFDEFIKSQPYNENGYLKKCHILETYQAQKFEENFKYKRQNCCCVKNQFIQRRPFNKPYDKMLECYEQFINNCPQNYNGYLKKLKIFFKFLNKVRKLQNGLKDLMEEIENVQKYLNNLENVLNIINNYEDAIQCCKQLIKICPQQEYGYIQLGEILKLHGHNEVGVQYFQQMIQNFPNNKLGYFNKGYFLEKLNRFDEACQCYEELISIQPTIEEGYWYKGQLLEKLNRPIEAIECIDRFIQIQPQNDFGTRYKKQILESMNENKQAI